MATAALILSLREGKDAISLNDDEVKAYIANKLNEIPEVSLSSANLSVVIGHLDEGSPFNHQATDFFTIDALVERAKLDTFYVDAIRLQELSLEGQSIEKIPFLDRALNIDKFCSSLDKLKVKIQSCNTFSNKPFVLALDKNSLLIFSKTAIDDVVWVRVWEWYDTGF